MAKKQAPTDDVYDKHKILFATFVGSMIELLLEGGDNLIPMSGILLDFDSTWLYIGSSIEKISTAVRIEKVALIAYEGEIGFQTDSPLDDLEEPENDMDYN